MSRRLRTLLVGAVAVVSLGWAGSASACEQPSGPFVVHDSFTGVYAGVVVDGRGVGVAAGNGSGQNSQNTYVGAGDGYGNTKLSVCFHSG